MPSTKQLLTISAVVAALAGSTAATASADSIAYVKGGDVFLTTTDGARQFQVTTGGGYDHVSQADDGTLLASTVADSHLRRLDRYGKVLSDIPTPVSDHAPGPYTFEGPFDADISPDGKNAGYGYIETGLFSDPTTGEQYADTKNGTGYTKSDTLTGFTDDGYKHSQDWDAPEFVDNTHVLLSNGPLGPYIDPIAVDTIGSGDPKPWFTDDNVHHPMEATISRNLLAIAVVNGPERKQLVVYRDTDGKLGTTPGQPVNVGSCFTYADSGINSPTFNADGSKGFWGTDKGVQAASFSLASDCGSAQDSTTIAPGGSSPDWGPADVPTTRPAGATPAVTPSPSGSPQPGSGSTPVATRCVVPKLRGTTLAGARRKLTKAHCALGKVTRKRARRNGRVLKSRTAAGRVLAAGTKVSLVVGRHR